MSSDFFDISGDTIKAAEAAAEFRMASPKTARLGKDGSENWTEMGRILSATSDSAETELEGRKTPVLILALEIQVGAEGSGLNKDFVLKPGLRINRYALTNGREAPKGTPLQKQYTMSRISVSRLKQLYRAMGVEPDLEDGGYSQSIQAAAFPPVGEFSGEGSFLVGREVWFEVRQRKVARRDGQGEFWNIDVSTFLPNAGE